MPITPSLFHDYASWLLECVCEALRTQASCGCPPCACVDVGLIAFDHCCDAGQLTVTLGPIRPYGAFPLPTDQPQTCQSPLAGLLTVTLLRCAPTMHDDGSPPTCAEKDASALMAYEDAYIIMDAVLCCSAALSEDSSNRFLVGDQNFVGPEGGCVGSTLSMWIELVDPFILP